MELKALALTTDAATSEKLRGLLANFGIELQVCPSPAAGLRLLRSERFEGILVDCDELDCGTDLLAMLRDECYSRTCVVFALVAGRTSMHEAFDYGANFVLEKPLNLDRAQRCFRAAKGLMVGERRRYSRYAVEGEVTLDFPKSISGGSARIMDVSLDGMLIECPLDLQADMHGTLSFALPGIRETIEGKCRVVWVRERQVGLQFVGLKSKSRAALEAWVGSQFQTDEPAHRPASEALPNVAC